MGLLDGLEKLINEHGSATILKERIALLNDQHALVEKQAAALKEQITHLQGENERLKLDKQQLQQQIKTLESSHNINPHNYVCDHCGSDNLNRAGSRPDPTFGDLGIKQSLFNCLSCGKQSAFTQNP
ncbi:MAG TPA: hypothetical protein PKL53_09230 [Methylotenera sp.]|nr:hypothetical protein [Methylotenera sp.]HPV44485.1 hypothetical protein [Methylotenera sp.]